MSITKLSPRGLFFANAIDATGDKHIADGIHLLLKPSIQLGLPVVPFQIGRFKLAEDMWRKDGFEINSPQSGTVTPPFQVSPGERFTIWLDDNKTACLFKFDATPAPSRKLFFSSVYDTPLGPQIMENISKKPYYFSFPYIKKAYITGEGNIKEVKWLDVETILDYGRKICKNWRFLPLPIPEGRHYRGIDVADKLANERIMNGAPKTQGLNISYQPQTITSLYELERIRMLVEMGPEKWLDQVVNTPGSPWDVTETHQLFNEEGKTIGETELNLLQALFHASTDPGIARWLGFMMRDNIEPGWKKGDIIVYLIRGFWQAKKHHFPFYYPLIKDAVLNQLSDHANLEGPVIQLWTVCCVIIGYPPPQPNPPYRKQVESGPWLPETPPKARREVTLHLKALRPGASIALYRQSNAAGEPVNLNPTLDGQFLSQIISTPKDAEEPGCGEITDRQAPEHKFYYHVAQADWFGRWSQWGKIYVPPKERPKPPKPVFFPTYTPAAFSEPIPENKLAGQIRIQVQVPPIESLSPGSRLLKEIKIHLSGGGFYHEEIVSYSSVSPDNIIDISINGPPLGRTEEKNIIVYAYWIDENDTHSIRSDEYPLRVFDARPPIGCTIDESLLYTSRPDVTGRVKATLVWKTNSTTQKHFRIFYSDESRIEKWLDEISQDANDSRQNRAVDILNQINPPGPAHSRPNRRKRANIILDNKSILEKDVFEQLTQDPLPADFNNPDNRFVHDLSGSLEIISFYRIIAISRSNVEESWHDSALIPVAVPHEIVPSLPFLEVRPVRKGEKTEIETHLHPLIFTKTDIHEKSPSFLVKVTIPAGLIRSKYFRLRRSAYTSSDHLGMPIVLEREIPTDAQNAADEEPQVFYVFDSGSSRINPDSFLLSWFTYTWCIEVRGEEEQIDAPKTYWGTPSAPVSAKDIPLDPPKPVENLSVQTNKYPGGFKITWEHEDVLKGGDMGTYIFEVYKQEPGDRQVPLLTIPANAEEKMGGRSKDGTGYFWFFEESIAEGTVYYVVLIDPLGRRSISKKLKYEIIGDFIK